MSQQKSQKSLYALAITLMISYLILKKTGFSHETLRFVKVGIGILFCAFTVFFFQQNRKNNGS